MKRIAFLKTLVHITFILCMIAVFFGLPFILILAFFPTKVPFNFNGHLIDAGRFEIIFLYLMLYAGHCAFTYGVFLFRKTLELFSKRRFFDPAVITNLDQMGKAFIVCAMLWTVPPFFYHLLAHGEFDMEIGFSGFESPFFIFSLGLFFIVLSEVFFNAKQLKEENDLTV
jgi:hypothetical protein